MTIWPASENQSDARSDEVTMLETYKGKTVVIKYGGAAMQSEELKAGVIEDIAWLAGTGADVVLVHGGGPELSALQKRLGLKPHFVDGLRYTDEDTMEAALMALCGKVNKELVRLLQNQGIKSVGISGIDGGLLLCEKQSSPDIGFVGNVQKVGTDILKTLMKDCYIPVVSTVGLGEDGQLYNVNADTAAAEIAVGLAADDYITISDIPGLLRAADDPESLIGEIKANDVEGLIEEGVITGGMIPKARGLAGAVRNGAARASIIDGRVINALRLWMNGEIAGTRFIDG